ncbi:tyrosine-type recombinase/integrase, partial [Salmonella enterica subsp. enterica serovar Enteritidis]|nr:tyrosine-type recombinase/integrase [Salmonella enterica subsp. enterica serovar Enteritidis]
RLQQLHSFAHKKFGIVNVDIPEAKSEKKVRAEWISFALYQAILRQIRLNVDSLEADMLLSLFILLYRTGMRKLELLGLRYSDIENLNSGQPSIIVRPNQHRRLKTDVSNRRIPIYALLMPEELQFVLDFLQSNRSNDRHQLVFTLSTSKERLPSTFINQLLANILVDIDPRKIFHVIHGFRHTAISNISLILNSDIRLASTITGFDAGQITNIKSELLGQDEYNQ